MMRADKNMQQAEVAQTQGAKERNKGPRHEGTEYRPLRALAEATGLSDRTIRRAVIEGKIATKRFGGAVLIPRKEYERVLKNGW
jgi:excisionase family DNA binding protein